MFLRLAATIDRALVTDLRKLPSYYERMKSYETAQKSSEAERHKPFRDFLDEEASQSLCNAGLAFSRNAVAQDICIPTAVGSCLIEVLFD